MRRHLQCYERLKERLPRVTADLVTLGREWQFIEKELARHPPLRTLGLSAECSACMAYTSGAQGIEDMKIQHRSVLDVLAAIEPRLRFEESDVWALAHSAAFELSVRELCGALLYGGRLVIVPRLLTHETAQFYGVCRREIVKVLNQTAGEFKQLYEVQRKVAGKNHFRIGIVGSGARDLQSLGIPIARNREERYPPLSMRELADPNVRVS